jgi:hypothetical protein
MKSLNFFQRRLLLLTLAVLALLSGCDRAAIMQKAVSKDDEEFAQHAVDLLKEQRFDEIKRESTPEFIDYPYLDETLARMAEMFPPAEVKSVKPVGLRSSQDSGVYTSTLTLEYEFPGKWLLSDVTISRMNGRREIAGLSVTPIQDSLENVNRFNLRGKDALEYSILGLAIAAPVFTVCVLVICFRTKNVRKKWLWAIFVLLGVGKLSLNWTTGDLSWRSLSVQIPCGHPTASPAYGPYGPWIISLALPLGAILFLVKRNRILQQTQVETQSSVEQPPTTPLE